MLDRVSRAGASAINVDAGCGSEIEITAGCDSDDSNWFAITARKLLGKEAGLHLHYITGFPESSCNKYVQREKPRQPPAYFLRALLRSPQGSPFLAAVMDGCEQPWWIELQTARDFCSKFKIEPR